MSADRKRPPVGPSHPDAHRRNFFRLLFNPLAAAVHGYELPANHTSKNPPVRRAVLAPGPGNRAVLALLGPLATGTPAAGHSLHRVQVGEEDLRVVFHREGRLVSVLLAKPGERPGRVVGATRTFTVIVEGDEPADEEVEVAQAVLSVVAPRDQGQLWVSSSSAPLKHAP